MPNPPDGELVHRVKHGDKLAFDELMQKYQQEVITVAYRMLDHYEDALDVAQETFFRAYRGLPRFREEAAGFFPEPQPMQQRVGASWSHDSKRERGRISMLAEVSGAAKSPQVFDREEKTADRAAEEFEQAMAQVQQTGLLPFRIAVPRSGRPHLFGKLLTTGEPLTIQVRYLRSPITTLLSGGIGLLGLLGLGRGFRIFRRRR